MKTVFERAVDDGRPWKRGLWPRRKANRTGRAIQAGATWLQVGTHTNFLERNVMFTYVAKASPQGNENIARTCVNSKCGGKMYVSYNADNYRCPHCDWKQQ